MKWILFLIFFINTTSKAQIQMAHGQDIGYTIMSGDGKTFATVGKRSGTIKVWSSATGSFIKKIQQVRSPADNKFYPLPKDSIYLYESTLYNAGELKKEKAAIPVKISESRQTKDGKKGMTITITSKDETKTYFYEGMTYASVSRNSYGYCNFSLGKDADSLYSYLVYPGKAPYLYGVETYKTQTLNGLFDANFTNLMSSKGEFLFNLASKKKIWEQPAPLFTEAEKISHAAHMLNEKNYYAATATKVQVINVADGKLLKTFTLDTFFYPRGFFLRPKPVPYNKFKNYRMIPLPDLSGYVYAPHTINWSGRDMADEVQAWLVKNGSTPIPLIDGNSKAEYAVQKDEIDQYFKKDFDYLADMDILTELVNIKQRVQGQMFKMPLVRIAEADETKGLVYTFKEPGDYLITAYGPAITEVLLYSEGQKRWVTQENLKWSEIQGDYSKWDRGCTNSIITSVPNVSMRFILISDAPVDGAITVVKR